MSVCDVQMLLYSRTCLMSAKLWLHLASRRSDVANLSKWRCASSGKALFSTEGVSLYCKIVQSLEIFCYSGMLLPQVCDFGLLMYIKASNDNYVIFI